jgi:uroporphyrinogen-III synthase/type II secretory pathway pseudopilin PulG
VRALITRPEADAAPLAAALRRRGVDCLIEPMLRIVPVAAPPPALDGVQGLVVTSANGVRAFAAACPRRDLAVFAVGPASAQAARELGFRQVADAAGDVAALVELVTRSVDPAAGALLHPAGSVTAGDLAAALGARGVAVRRVAAYEAQAATGFSPALTAALRELVETAGAAPDRAAALRWVLFFSPRTAATFVRLCRASGLADACRHLVALCLSENVARAAAAVEWAALGVATRPDQDALLELLDRDLGTAFRDRDDGDGHSVRPTAHGRPLEGTDDRMNDPSDQSPATAGAERDRIVAVVERFGGIRPMAAKLGIAFTTVQGWKERGHIPPQRHAGILRIAAEHGIPLDAEELTAVAPAAGAAEPEPAEEKAEAAPPEPPAIEAPPAPFEAGPEPATLEIEAEAPVPPPGAVAPPPSPAARRRGGALAGAVAALIVLGLVAGLAAATLPQWRPWLAARVAAPADEALRDRLARLETDFADRATQVDAQAARLTALERRPDVPAGDGKVSAAVQGLQAQSANLDERLAALTERLTAVEARPQGAPEGAASAALGTAVADLRAQAADVDQRLGSFERELTAVQNRLSEITVDDDLASLRTELTALDSSVSEQLAPLVARTDEIGEAIREAREQTSQAVAGIDGRLGEFEQGLQTTEIESRLAALEEKAAKLSPSRAASMVLAWIHLAFAVQGSGPFSAELDMVQRVVEDDQGLTEQLAALTAHAASGVPSVAMLEARFPATAAAITLANAAPVGEGWFATSVRRLMGLVSLRPTDEATAGSGVMAQLARAQAVLAADDLDGAVSTLETLEGPAAAAAAPWLADAQARLTVERALSAFYARALAIIDGTNGGG